MTKIYVSSKKELDLLYNESALTLIGLHESSIPDFLEWIKERTDIINDEVYIIKGDFMNKSYGLTGNNAYVNDLSIVSIPLSNLKEPNNLILARFDIGAKWFDDIVDNNARRENAGW